MRIFSAIIVVVAVYQIIKILTSHLRRKAVVRSIVASAENLGMLATTPEQVREHNLRVLERSGDTVNYKRYLHSYTFDMIDKGQLTCQYVERLKKAGCLKPVDQIGLSLFPDAKYELANTVRVKVYFRKNLTLAGTKDYSLEIEQIILRVIEQRQLSAVDAELLKRVCHIHTSEKFGGEYYGGPGFPYPDQRYHINGMANGLSADLYLDENFNLVVAQQESAPQKWDKVILWERPGACQPELYKKKLVSVSQS